eukprot:COSAG03_NODE_5373_length_1266_cov_1.118252_2_plen_64_part_00
MEPIEASERSNDPQEVIDLPLVVCLLIAPRGSFFAVLAPRFAVLAPRFALRVRAERWVAQPIQ